MKRFDGERRGRRHVRPDTADSGLIRPRASSSPPAPARAISDCRTNSSSSATASPVAPPATAPSTATCRSPSSAAATPPARKPTFLTRFASTVYLIHRRDRCAPRRSWPTACWRIRRSSRSGTARSSEYLTDEQGEMRRRDSRISSTGAESQLEVKCVFVAIGHVPNTAVPRRPRRSR